MPRRRYECEGSEVRFRKPIITLAAIRKVAAGRLTCTTEAMNETDPRPVAEYCDTCNLPETRDPQHWTHTHRAAGHDVRPVRSEGK